MKASVSYRGSRAGPRRSLDLKPGSQCSSPTSGTQGKPLPFSEILSSVSIILAGALLFLLTIRDSKLANGSMGHWSEVGVPFSWMLVPLSTEPLSLTFPSWPPAPAWQNLCWPSSFQRWRFSWVRTDHIEDIRDLCH